MKEFPKPYIYEQFFKVTPWGNLISEVVSTIQKNAPANSTILDLMCGTGFLLNEIQKERKDLKLEGIDLNTEYIKYAEENYRSINFQIANSTKWTTEEKFDVVVCTGGLHHLSYSEKELFIDKISKLLNENGFAIIADPYIDDYTNELERKKAAAKLGYEYLNNTIESNASDKIIESTIDILYNDVLQFEFKTSIKKIEPVFKKYFRVIEIKKTWQANDYEFGDYYLTCRN